MFWERFTAECMRIGKKPNSIREELGVSSSTLTKWKNGAMPTARTLNTVASYFGVTSDYLLGKSDQRTAPTEELEGVDFALSGEIREMSENEKQDLLDYIRFKKSQRGNAMTLDELYIYAEDREIEVDDFFHARTGICVFSRRMDCNRYQENQNKSGREDNTGA